MTKGTVKADYFDEFFEGRWIFTTDIKNRSERLRRCDLSFVACDETIGPAARELLYALAIVGDDPVYDYKQQYTYMNNGGAECFMYRGGYWGNGAFAGVFCWSCSAGRSHIFEGLGFRSSYIPL